MSNQGTISTYRPSLEEGVSRFRNGDVAGLFATDGICSYAFSGTAPGGKLVAMVTAASGRVRRQAYPLASLEFKATQACWAFESELDAYLKRERYVRLDPDTCARLALQLVHKCMRNPLEAFHDRISDTEMMGFNRACLNRVFTVLVHAFDPAYRVVLLEKLAAPTNWDPPALADEMDPWLGSRPGQRPDVSLKASSAVVQKS